MLNELKNNQNLIVSVPTHIKETIDRLFQSSYSQLHLDKIYFLVHKINKEKSYQVHSANHAWLLGWKCGEVSEVLTRLTNAKVIQLVQGYVKGTCSNKYSLVTPYSIRDNNLFRINYYQGQIKFPTWVQKLVADGGIAKNASTTNWKKAVKETKVKTVSNTDIVVKQQALIIAELKEKIAALEAQIKPTVEPTYNSGTTISTADSIALNVLELKNNKGAIFNVETDNINQFVIDQLIKKFSPNNPTITVKDENHKMLRFSNINSTLKLYMTA